MSAFQSLSIIYSFYQICWGIPNLGYILVTTDLGSRRVWNTCKSSAVLMIPVPKLTSWFDLSVYVKGTLSSTSTRPMSSSSRGQSHQSQRATSSSKDSGVTQHRISTAYVPACTARRRHRHAYSQQDDCPCLCSWQYARVRAPLGSEWWSVSANALNFDRICWRRH